MRQFLIYIAHSCKGFGSQTAEFTITSFDLASVTTKLCFL